MRKITIKVYIEVVLPSIKDELLSQGLTLYHDADSAYTSKKTTKYCLDNKIPVITLPKVSLNFSILESIAHLIKRRFHAKQCATEKATIARFLYLFKEEMD